MLVSGTGRWAPVKERAMDDLIEYGMVAETTRHGGPGGDRVDPIAWNCTAHEDDPPGCGPWQDEL